MEERDILKQYIYTKILNYEYNHSDIISYIKKSGSKDMSMFSDGLGKLPFYQQTGHS